MRIPRFVWVALGIVATGVVLLAAKTFVPNSDSRTRTASGRPEGANWVIEGNSLQQGTHAEQKLPGGRSPRERKESLTVASATSGSSGTETATTPPIPNTVVVPSPPGPESWATFRNGYGQLGIATTTLPDDPQPLWKIKTSEGMVGCAAVVGGQVYLPCLNGQLLSVDRLTGKPQWSYRSIESTNPNDFAPGFKAAPTVSIDTVYVGDEEGNLHAVDRKNGKLKWKFTTGNEIAGSVALVGENIIFGSHDSFLYCLKASDHSVVWKFQTENFVNCSTAIEGNYTFIAGCDTKVRVIDIREGKEVYEVPLGEGAYLIASPAVMGNMLYVGTHDGRVVGVDWKAQRVVWTFIDEAHPLEYRSSAAVTDKFVILGGYDKKLHCLDRATGKEVWNFPTRGHVESSPAVVGERVFFGSGDGNVYAVTLKEGKKVWQFRAGRSITSSPAVGEKCLVIGTDGPDGTVYCFGAKSP
ncbi:MAG TPA: PQQ-binding-like beta-propeller repeat protein [Planctomycetaceae bacterium]|jgi:outer membrane protein assembly factor BamB|nr:PQQ-binding-like beta-propeller repeat protein [Planctomycetaceae bacterium]